MYELPSKSIVSRESEHILLSFCTLCTILKGKKLSFQNVFILLLDNDHLREMLKEMLSIDNNFELVKAFIDHDPLITTSKYVTRYLNLHPELKL